MVNIFIVYHGNIYIVNKHNKMTFEISYNKKWIALIPSGHQSDSKYDMIR